MFDLKKYVLINCMQVGCPIKTNNVRQLWTLAGHVSGRLENLSGSTAKHDTVGQCGVVMYARLTRKNLEPQENAIEVSTWRNVEWP